MRTLLFLLLTLPFAVQAQTSIYSQDFESGGADFDLNTTDLGGFTNGNNTWLVNNEYTGGTGTITCLGFPFTYTVPGTANQPAGITGSPTSTYLHLAATEAVNQGITCASFLVADGLCTTDETYFTAMNTDISTEGFSDVELSFWWMCGAGTVAYGEAYYSTDGGGSWNQITSPFSEFNFQTTWLESSFSAPELDDQAQLRFGFRFVNSVDLSVTDPGFCIDQIEVTGNGSGNSVSTGVIDPLSYCLGDAVTIPYTATGDFGPANLFIAELSDENGSFAAPQFIGTVFTTDLAGDIAGAIPLDIPDGTGYRIRVIATDPAWEGPDNGEDITIENCQIEGCTDPEAYNYDAEATVDNGCCFYVDFSSICGPGTSYDAITGLCMPDCQADFDGDGHIGTTDLLVFLGLFGTDCSEL